MQIEIENFLQSKNWQEEFNSLSNLELKIAAICTSLNCPKRTCRKDLFFKLVLHFLKVRTSQTPKEDFKRIFNKVLNQLISQRIFREYNRNKPHPRVKYDKYPHSEHLISLLNKYFAIEANPQFKLERLQ